MLHLPLPFEYCLGLVLCVIIGTGMVCEAMGWIKLQMPPDEPEPDILVIVVERPQE